MRAFLILTIFSATAVCGDYKEIKIANNTKVINNLIMPIKLKPLMIDEPPATPAPLTMRPFRFNPNMGPLPQKGNDYKSPFTGATPDNIPNPFIINNIVTRKSQTSIEYKAK